MSKPRKPDAADKIAATVWFNEGGVFTPEQREKRLAARIRAREKRVVREAQRKTAEDCYNMNLDARGVHHFEEMLRQKYGIRKL